MRIKQSRGYCLSLSILLLCILGIASVSAAGGLNRYGVETDNPYVVRRFVQDGREIDEVIVPGRPPEFYRVPQAVIPEPISAAAVKTLPNVPAFDWSYGCSATSAAMMFGYYDNTGYPNLYAGPANGGVCPMTNAVWGPGIGGSTGECPLSATHLGIDGRSVRGHVDDYWIEYGSTAQDPFIGSWTEHAQGECTGDFMGTNQSRFDNSDASTTFWLSSTPLYDYIPADPSERDGCHGMRLFFESRGYSVTSNYTQYILGSVSNTKGFTFDQYKQEIDAGRPVLIQVEGHTMLGYGYDDSGSVVYLRDTWDYGSHQMIWGGKYSNMQHYGVTVFVPEPAPSTPILTVTPTSQNVAKEAGTATFSVSNAGPETMSWTAEVITGGDWLSITSGDSGIDTGTIACAFDENTTTSERFGTIRVTAGGATGSPKDVTVSQAGIIPPTLTGLSIDGPATVNENSTETYEAKAHWSDGTETTVTKSSTWKENSYYALISIEGVLTTKTVTRNQTVTITATYTSGGITKSATKSVTIVNLSTKTLTGLRIDGPATVNENNTGTYTATAIWSDSSTTIVTSASTWGEDSAYASIADGELTAGEVAGDQTVTITASYTYGGATKSATKSVTIVDSTLTLVGLIISGPDAVNENNAGTYTATASWSDSSTTIVTSASTWGEDSAYASIADGELTAGDVVSNQTVTITASYTFGGVTKSATKSVTIVDSTLTLIGLSISGPDAVNENNAGTYTATASWSDSSTTIVTSASTWEVDSAYASIAGGDLTAGEVAGNQTVTITASYTFGGVTKSAMKSVTIVDLSTKTLTGLRIDGPATVNERSTETYTAEASWSDGLTTTVTATWRENSYYALISAGGVLTAKAVTRNQMVVITAIYASGGITKSATKSVTILNVP